jgi:hypothetical protein
MADLLSAQELRRLDQQLEAIWSMPAPLPVEERPRYTVRDLETGVHFELESRTYRVEKVHRYEKGQDWLWWDLVVFCLETGETQYLDWKEEDRVQMKLTESAGLSLYDLGATRDQVEGIVKTGGELYYRGVRYGYREDSWARYQDDPDQPGEGMPVWLIEFQGESERYLTIEAWQYGKDWDYEVHLGRYVHPAAINVIALPG